MSSKKKKTRNPKELWEKERPGRCNYRTKHTLKNGKKKRCRAWPAKGGKHCNVHAKKCLSGPDHPNWKGGTSRHTMRKYLPERMLEKFDAIVNDPELVSVRGNLAVMYIRLGELMERLETYESSNAWEQIGSKLEAIEEAEDLDEVYALVLEAKEHHKAAEEEKNLWGEIFVVMEQSRKQADTERRREEALQANINAKQAIALFNQLFQLLVEEIEDARVRARVGERLRGLLQREAPGIQQEEVVEADYEVVDD